MDELIKVAANGQWTLEKSANKPADAARTQQIQSFLSQKQTERQVQQARPVIPGKPSATSPNYPAGLRPAVISTQDYQDAKANAPQVDNKAMTRYQTDHEEKRRAAKIAPKVVERKMLDMPTVTEAQLAAERPKPPVGPVSPGIRKPAGEFAEHPMEEAYRHYQKMAEPVKKMFHDNPEFMQYLATKQKK